MASRNFMNLLGQLAGSVIRSLATKSGSGARPAGSRAQTEAARGARTNGADASPRPRGAAYDRELERRQAVAEGDPSPGQLGASATFEVDPPAAGELVFAYAPHADGDPDAGEVVWTWIPYDERDGRGKDRPVLVVARRDAQRVYAVRLTSKPHDGDRDYLSIGSGAWDSRGRESWVDVEQIYLVHADGMRREATALDARRFGAVAKALQSRYGWRTA